MIQRVAISCLHGVGDTFSAMVVRVIVNVCNVIFSISLVVGVGPLPKMGWNGIALGTAISHVIGAAILIAWMLRGRSGLKLDKSCLRLDRDLSGRLLKVGVPGGIDVLLILICHLWFVALINGLGTAQAAAHSLAIRIESLAYLPGTAFQVAATTLAGQYLGAKDPARASKSVWAALFLGGGVMSLAGVVFYTSGLQASNFFTGGKNLVTSEQAATLLRIASIAMPMLATNMIVTGALRGAGDTRLPLVINVLGMLGVRIVGTYLFLHVEVFTSWSSALNPTSPNHALLQAAWWLMVADICVRAVLMMSRFLHGGWKHTKV
jgi:putative MATE family efflux protein